jgi:hypothetical protein
MSAAQQADYPPLRGFKKLFQYFMIGSREDSHMRAPQKTDDPPLSSCPTLWRSWEGVLLVVIFAIMILALAFGFYFLARPSAFKTFDIVAGLVIEKEFYTSVHLQIHKSPSAERPVSLHRRAPALRPPP